MSANDHDFGPGIETPGARRDPRLSIERDTPPRRRITIPTRPEIPDWLVSGFAIAIVVAIVVVAGFVAHLAWYVVDWGWRILP